MIDFIEPAKELESSTDIVEHFADLFLKETGMMAPGKDQPAAFISPPDMDQRSQRYAEWLQADGFKRAKEMRLAYAIYLTRESMAMCEVPHHIRDKEIELLKKQMVERQRIEVYADTPVERYWNYRELHDLVWGRADKEADEPCSIAPNFRREEWR